MPHQSADWFAMTYRTGGAAAPPFFAVIAVDGFTKWRLVSWDKRLMGGICVEDWLKIKTEYITTDTSYRKLAEKYGVHRNVIAARGKDEKWPELRCQYRDKTVTEAVETIRNETVDRAARIHRVADKLLDRIEELAEDGDGRTMQAKSIRALSAAVKDLKDILGVRSDLDRQEQEARIANLRKQADPEQKETATLIVEGLPEEFRT